MFDVIISLDSNGFITTIEWKNPELQKSLGDIWSAYPGAVFSDIPAFVTNPDEETICWNDEEFQYYRFEMPGGESAVFLKYNDHMEELLKAALDIFPESIQLYDRNAMAVYFNNAGLSTMDFPHNEIKHKHVLELFEVDADYSTVLTALRTQNRIANRFCRYKARSGASFTTVNNAWPVFRDGKLLGIVDTEMNMEMVEGKIKELSRIEDALKESRLQVNQFSWKSLEDIPAESVAMKKLMIDAGRAAQKKDNLLISGEEGTETELLAYGICNTGLRKDRPVQVMNCAAIPEELQEQVLLGTETGNEDERTGLLEKADGGILLLEEVSSLSLRAQSILLHVLQGDSFRRTGGSDDIYSSFSVVSTTSELLPELVKTKNFRIDLYYRLSVCPLYIPPLRERRKDIRNLIQERIAANENLSIFRNRFSGISGKALQYMEAYPWPGNRKELNYAVDYAMSRGKGPEILPDDLPAFLTDNSAAADLPDEDFKPEDLKKAVEKFEQTYIRKTMNHYNGNISKSAEALGLKRQSLQYRLRKSRQ